MDLLSAFLLGLVTTGATEIAKKYNIPPRIMIAGIAGLLVACYMGVTLFVEKQEIDAALLSMSTVFTTWYATSTIAYEWGLKLFKKKDGK